MAFTDELHIITASMDRTHLSHAIDLMRLARRYCNKSQSKRKRNLGKRFVLSSIIHAFSGLESVINLLGFELFSNEDSSRFIPVDQRDFLLTKFIKTWDWAPCIDKVSFVLSHSSKTTLPPKLQNQLRELNTLRNWLVHGFSYKTTLLIEPNENGTFNVVDTEHSFDWVNKFANTKFKPLAQLGIEDAVLALTIVFEVLKIIADSTSQPFSLRTFVPRSEYKILLSQKFDIQRILR